VECMYIRHEFLPGVFVEEDFSWINGSIFAIECYGRNADVVRETHGRLDQADDSSEGQPGQLCPAEGFDHRRFQAARVLDHEWVGPREGRNEAEGLDTLGHARGELIWRS